MAGWGDVERVAADLPEVSASSAHEGSPALDVAGRQFARLRVDPDQGGRALLQFWVRDAGIQDGLVQSEPDVYLVHHRFAVPAVLAWLDRLDDAALRELLVESWTARGPKRLVRQHPDVR